MRPPTGLFLDAVECLDRPGYRTGGDEWEQYRKALNEKLIREAQPGGGWSDPQVGNVYTTSLNCIMLQLEKGFLPIYQR